MRIVYITAGAGGTICGNCLADNALASALRRLGHDVVLLPVYTPIRTDEEDVSDRRVYLGGVNIYLQKNFGLFRRLPKFLDRALDSPALLRQVAKFAVRTRPEELGALTVATLLGDDGPLRKEIGRLAEAVRGMKPDVVHLTNSMLIGAAARLRAECGVPVVSSLQGEDFFLERLPAPYSERCFDLLRAKAADVDRFIVPCLAQARSMGPRLGLDPASIAKVPPGIAAEDFAPRASRSPGPFTIGYLARLAPEKGLEALLGAAAALRGDAPLRLRAAGWISPEFEPYVERLEALSRKAGLEDAFECLGYVDRPAKAEFLRSLDVFSVPTAYGASKGLYCLEAWASGVPAVQPRIGVFPELIEASGGGLLYEPGDAVGLAAALRRLRDDPELAARLGRRGRQAVLEQFTAERMARDMVSIYSD